MKYSMGNSLAQIPYAIEGSSLFGIVLAGAPMCGMRLATRHIRHVFERG
jgi:hypothetical protein